MTAIFAKKKGSSSGAKLNANLADSHHGHRLGRRSAAKLLTKDEARRIAANIAKISRRLIQCESVQRDDFFPGQLIGGAPAHDGPHIASLDELATLRPNYRPCANLAHRLRSANYSGRRPGYGCGVSTANIMLPFLARSLSSDGGQMLPATSCAPVHAARVAARNVRASSVQAGPAIILASTRFRPASMTAHRQARRDE
jgi:hypothetical protein